MTTDDMFICSFVSSAPYFIGCDKGYMVLLSSKIKCERPCNAWINGKCIRLNEGNITGSGDSS